MTQNHIYNKKRIFSIIISLIEVVFITAAVLLYFGIIQLNHPPKDKYPIRGVDVSEYQGDIDWSVLSNQDIDFAFVKATEGSSYTDEYFSENWENASKTDLRIGAYHFFSLESPGKTQAEHFCDTVQGVPNMLPPVVDVEPYGAYKDITEKRCIRADRLAYRNGRKLRCKADNLHNVKVVPQADQRLISRLRYLDPQRLFKAAKGY